MLNVSGKEYEVVKEINYTKKKPCTFHWDNVKGVLMTFQELDRAYHH
jgi:hypothetical protein